MIERDGLAAICEVKEFTTDAMIRRWPQGGSGFGSFSETEWFLTVRRTISGAARQLEPLSGDDRPLVIVLANPQGVNVPLRADEVIEAMYGELTVTFSIDRETGAPASDPQWVLGEGGRLAEEQAPWVSAVAVLRKGDMRTDWVQAWVADWKKKNWPDAPKTTDEAVDRSLAANAELEKALASEDAPSGDYFYIEAIETISRDAVPLPRQLFDGERDQRWIVNEAESRYERLDADVPPAAEEKQE